MTRKKIGPESSFRASQLRAQNKALRKQLGSAAREAVQVERRSKEKDQRRARALAIANEATRQAKYDADEIRHRLKNLISVVQAIANATLLDGTPGQVSRAAFNERLAALSAATDILFKAGWESASVPAIIQGVLAPYQTNRIHARGPDIAIDPKPALAFALALNELANNASKYGALSIGSGYVDIVWSALPASKGKQLQLRWRERYGPRVSMPKREGFGSRLIKRHLAAEFNGRVKLEYRPRGVTCTLIATLEDRSLH